jgi:S1-C subfamily serine protease
MVSTLFIACQSNVKSTYPINVIGDIDNKTVALMIRGEDGEISRPVCTGVFVSEKVILTANHCVQLYIDKAKEDIASVISGEETPLSSVNIYWITKNEVTNVEEEPLATYLGHPLAQDAEHDIALIQVSGANVPKHGIAKLAAELPDVGAKLHFVGQTAGFYWTYMEGIVAGYRSGFKTVIKKGPFIQISGPIYKGNSGGGAFTQAGELVGIVSFLRMAVPNMSFLVHLDSIRAFLNKNNIVQ